MDDRIKAHFDVLYQSLKDYQSGFFDGAFTTSGFLVLVIGWVLTSKEARAYLGANVRARRLCALALLTGLAIYAGVSWRVFVLSQITYAGLVTLDYLPVVTYAAHRIDGLTVAVLLAQNALLTTVSCYLVLGTGRTAGAAAAAT